MCVANNYCVGGGWGWGVGGGGGVVGGGAAEYAHMLALVGYLVAWRRKRKAGTNELLYSAKVKKQQARRLALF